MQKKVKIFGVPVDLGATKLGVGMGPTAIRYANLREALTYNNIKHDDHGDLIISQSLYNNFNTPETNRREIAFISERLAHLTSEALSEGYIPVILGGDHSAAIGSIAGAAQHADRLGLIWLDFHPDANIPETSPSGNIHGMTVAISVGYGYQELVDCAGFHPKVLPEDICMIGINDIDPDAEVFLKDLGVIVFTLMDVEKLGIVKVVDEAVNIVSKNCDLVHLSFDIDVLDPLIAPGKGILSRGGLSYREISYVMKYFGANNVINSMDIIEVNPLLDVKNSTAELAVELLLAALGGSFGDYQRKYLQAQAFNKSIHNVSED